MSLDGFSKDETDFGSDSLEVLLGINMLIPVIPSDYFHLNLPTEKYLEILEIIS